MASSCKAAKQPITESKSRDIVPVGPRHVQSKYQGRRTDEGAKPTTARALVLRNGKYGARGTGEVVLASKISGREKLDLLGEDLLEKRVEMAKTALGPPFRLEKCLRIAHAQFNAALDDVKNLQDHEVFLSEIVAEIGARTPPNQYIKDPDYIASIVATRIHNAYTAASAWKLVRDTLHELDEEGLRDSTARNQIRRDEHIRSLYLVLYDLVNELIKIYQSKFSVYVMAAPHYAKYFKRATDSDPDDPEMMFDWVELKAVHRSFLDSIIIELCLPQSHYPKQVLYSILHDAVDESPKEAKRFSQAVWDAVGDLAMAVELQDIIESPMLGADCEQLKKRPREMPEEYEAWIDAQLFSDKAAKDLSIRNHAFPLAKTATKSGLETLWKTINANYKAVSGQGIDELWDLAEEKERTPQWHAFYMPSLGKDGEGPGALTRPGGGRGGKKRLAITAAGYESDNSMPSLQSVSDSEDEESDNEYEDEDEDEEDEEEYDDDDDYETESEDDGYDTDEEEQARELLREAMDYALRDPDFLNAKSSEELKLDDDLKGNAFLKLLGSLRGRLFSADPNLKTNRRTQPRKPFFGGRKPPAPEDFEDDDEVPPLEPISPSARRPAQRGVTMEEVEDEEVTAAKKKKKKPKKKKKKPSSTATAEQGKEESPAPAVSSPPEPVPASPSPVPSGAPTSPPQTPSKKKKKRGPSGASANGPKSPTPSVSSTAVNSSSGHLPFMSTSSLVAEQKAQSVHSYLHSEGLAATKEKVKSRRQPGDMALIKEKRGLFSGKFGSKEKDEDEESIKKGSKNSWFTRLGKKSTDLMHQLLSTKDDVKKGQAPMKWEQFLRVMRDMGFTYDPSTAGSSVKFDPPDPRDRPITFHKPHPDSTIQPIRLRQYAKDLKELYGWSEEDFYKALS
ncbi:hypothetical protein OE88DRAFT_1676255 [Heliocybe sulcata]|uniref:Uncharacterized protein n=1 Tax=Heliocybe sulcata TaxID=5364 RepID=A0A5C3NB33_9AGAM|nr:hypothetical protein OE88DRAFT_1676255 [Heliocybe sulcata]